MLDHHSVVLVVVDFQEKLLPHVPVADAIMAKALTLIRFARELEIPILWTEQYPKGLGRTSSTIADALPGMTPIEKMTFGCLDDAGFSEALKQTGRRQLLMTGIEAHVCVMQTALQALHNGFDVYVARDAVGSRARDEYLAGLSRMDRAGGHIVTTEMAMFEILRVAGTPEFKRVLPLIK